DPWHLGVPALRQPRGPERARPAEPAPRRALQDAPRLREGAPQRLRRRGHPGRSPGPPARRLSLAAPAACAAPELRSLNPAPAPPARHETPVPVRSNALEPGFHRVSPDARASLMRS